MSTSGKIKRHMRGEPLSCETVNRFLADYMEGVMDEQTRVRYEAHLRNCPNCERFLDQYRETVTLVRRDAAVDVPEEVVSRTIDFLKHHYDEDA